MFNQGSLKNHAKRYLKVATGLFYTHIADIQSKINEISQLISIYRHILNNNLCSLHLQSYMMLLESHTSPQKSEIYLTFLFSTYLEVKFGHVGQVAELSCFYHWKEWLVNYKISQN